MTAMVAAETKTKKMTVVLPEMVTVSIESIGVIAVVELIIPRVSHFLKRLIYLRGCYIKSK